MQYNLLEFKESSLADLKLTEQKYLPQGVPKFFGKNRLILSGRWRCEDHVFLTFHAKEEQRLKSNII